MRKHLGNLPAALAIYRTNAFVFARGRFVSTLTSLCLIAVCMTAANGADLISNGNFSNNGGIGQLENGISYATGWTRTIVANPESGGFAFIVDANADATGFASVFTPSSGTNIYVWGPDTPPIKGGPVANGFTGSPDGGDFIGISAAYGQSSISQSVSGLAIGEQYLLSFQWAQSQFTDSIGPTTSGWDVSFGSESTSTGLVALASQGFNGWNNFSHTFTATSTTQTLTFLANGTTQLSPFVLLDGVSLQPVPEPSTYALGAFATGVMAFVARRRKTRRA